MLSVQQAEHTILALTHPLNATEDTERLDLMKSPGRILSIAIQSALDFPHWDNSAMDGYAVRYTDVQTCSADRPVTLEIVEAIPAGYQPRSMIQSGQAARILTGSIMPVGADTIVIQEDTQRQGDRVTILKAPQPQAFVRHRASFYQAGTPLLPGGTRLQAPEIAILAAAQCAQVQVYRKPRVAIFSTGDELVGLTHPLQPGQIVDSNQYALSVLVAQVGAEPLLLGIVPDRPESLKQTMQQAIAMADVVISSGGVSVGDYDYVDEVLANLGAEIHIRAVAMKPGKPLTVATFSGGCLVQSKSAPVNATPPTATRSVLYFGLPGNPVSTLVTFWRFVQPALRKLSGVPGPWEATLMTAKTRQPLRSDGKRETYIWGRLNPTAGSYEFDAATGSHSSGNLINLAGVNGLAVLPIGHTLIDAGEVVPVLPVG